MPDYCTLAEVRDELVKQGSSAMDDSAIVARIPRATAWVNAFCRHSFDQETVVDERRRGDQVMLTHDGMLTVSVGKGYCQSVSAAATSADLAAWEAVDVSALDIDRYVVTFARPPALARRDRPLFARINYVGGYPAAAPEMALVKQAACRLAAFMYMKRQAPFEVTAFPDVGQISIPSAMPSDVAQVLAPLVRWRP